MVLRHPQKPWSTPYKTQQERSVRVVFGRDWMSIVAPKRSVAVIFAVNVPRGNEGIRGLKRDSFQRTMAPIARSQTKTWITAGGK